MIPTMKNYKRTYFVTVQNPLFREVFQHAYAKIQKAACQNSIAKGDFIEFWLRICEGTEQISYFMHWKEGAIWNLEPGWMADTRYCVSSEKEVKAVCIWRFMKNYFDFMQ